MKTEKTIGVFFGSRSPEHDISILTAMRVREGFGEISEFRAIPVYISKRGQWFSGKELGNVSFFQLPRLDERLRPHAVKALGFEQGTLKLKKPSGFFGGRRETIIDLAFPCFHGQFGEDGTIQGFFETVGLPYVGCGVLASAVTMSKIHARKIFSQDGIPGVPTIEVLKEEFIRNRERILAEIQSKFSFPMFVKPNALGSSIAVSKVRDEKELAFALEVVFEFDSLALVEMAVANIKEINVAVMGHRELTVSQTEEPRYGSAFQTFEEKYVIKGGTITQTASKGKKGGTKSKIPADISPQLETTLKHAAAKAFRLIGASGISRFDFFVNAASGQWYLAEVNTLPGTLQAHLWEASGVPLKELIRRLIGFAEERFGEERGFLRAFASSVLQK